MFRTFKDNSKETEKIGNHCKNCDISFYDDECLCPACSSKLACNRCGKEVDLNGRCPRCNNRD